MELTINISQREKSIFEIPIIGAILKIVASIIMVKATILAIILVMPYRFIKYKLLGYKQTEEKNPEPLTFIETDNYKLTREYIEDPNDEHQLALDFLYSIVEYGDESAVFFVRNDGKKTELDGKYLTLFQHKLNDCLMLQQIRINEFGEPTSDLIKFDIISGKIQATREIGQFELDKFDTDKNEIVGYNTEENITIKVQKAFA